MNRLIGYLQISLIVLLAIFFIPHVSKEIKHSQKTHRAPEISYPVTEEKPFVIVIPSYNNSLYCDDNLRSVFRQKYSNYRVIYIDDCSSDGNFEKAKELTTAAHQEHRVQLIGNQARKGAMENYYRAFMSCKDDEIVLALDGDDWLAHDWVLQRLNEIYADPNVWVTYGSHCYYPSYIKGECAQKIPRKVRKTNTIREHVQKGWILSHLRTFYAGLFKQIQLEHMMYKGKFLESTSDQAFMLPIVEMGGNHVFFVEDILYIYNRATALNDDKVDFSKQQECMRYVWSLPVYPPLAERPSRPAEIAIK